LGSVWKRLGTVWDRDRIAVGSFGTVFCIVSKTVLEPFEIVFDNSLGSFEIVVRSFWEVLEPFGVMCG